MVIEITAVLIALAIAIALAFLLARSLNASLRRLREGAMTVANHDLPDAVARLRDVRSLGEGGADEIVKELRDPIRLNTRDEVGEVAQAFNVVHREASGSRPSRPRCVPASPRCSSTWPAARRRWSTA